MSHAVVVLKQKLLFIKHIERDCSMLESLGRGGSPAFQHCLGQCVHLGGILALRAHCVLLLDQVPPEEPPGTPLPNTLKIGRSKLP